MPTDELSAAPKGPKRITAILGERCPRCREGKMFMHPVYSFKSTAMYEHCPLCGQKFEIEPGFFWGSMYISYALTIMVTLIFTISTYYLLHDPEVWIYLVILTIGLVILSPLIFRYSRVFMLYWFGSIDYEPGAKYRN